MTVFICVLPQNSPCSYTPLYGIAARLPTPYLTHNIHCTRIHSAFLASPHTRLSPHKTALLCTFPPVISRFEHAHSGSMASPALREAMLPGATASCYNMLTMKMNFKAMTSAKRISRFQQCLQKNNNFIGCYICL